MFIFILKIFLCIVCVKLSVICGILLSSPLLVILSITIKGDLEYIATKIVNIILLILLLATFLSTSIILSYKSILFIMSL